MTVSGAGGQQPNYVNNNGESIQFGQNTAVGQRNGEVADTIDYSEGMEILLANIYADYPSLYPPNENIALGDPSKLFDPENQNDPTVFTPDARYLVLMSQHLKDPTKIDPQLKEEVLFFSFYPEELGKLVQENADPKWKVIQSAIENIENEVIEEMVAEGFEIPEGWKPEKKQEEFHKALERVRGSKLGQKLAQGSEFAKGKNLSEADLNQLRNANWGLSSKEELPKNLKEAYDALVAEIDAEIITEFSVPAGMVGNDGLITIDIDNAEYLMSAQSSYDLQFEEFLRANLSEEFTSIDVMSAIYAYYNDWDESVSPEIREKVANLTQQFSEVFRKQYGLPKDWEPIPLSGMYNQSVLSTQKYLIHKYLNPTQFGLDANLIPKNVREELLAYLTDAAQGKQTELSPEGLAGLEQLARLVGEDLHLMTGVPFDAMPPLGFASLTKQEGYNLTMLGQIDAQMNTLRGMISEMPDGRKKAILSQVLSLIDQMLQKVKILMFYIQNVDSEAAKANIKATLDNQLAIANKQMAAIKKMQEKKEEIRKKEEEAKEKEEEVGPWAEIGKWTGYIVGGAIALIAAPFTLGASVVVFAMMVTMIETQSEPPTPGEEGFEGLRGVVVDCLEWTGMDEETMEWMSYTITSLLLVAAATNPMMLGQILFQGGVIKDFVKEVVVKVVEFHGGEMTEEDIMWTCFALEMAWMVMELIAVTIATGGAGSAASVGRMIVKTAQATGRAAKTAGQVALKVSQQTLYATARQAAQAAAKAAKAAAEATARGARSAGSAIKAAPKQGLNKFLEKIDDISYSIQKLKNFKNLSNTQKFERLKIELVKKLLYTNWKKVGGKAVSNAASGFYAGSTAYTQIQQMNLLKMQGDILNERADLAEMKGELEAFIQFLQEMIKILRDLVANLHAGLSDAGEFAVQINNTMKKIKDMWSQSISNISQA